MVDEAIKMLSGNLLAQLTDEYEAWNKAQGLTLGSADEHLFDEFDRCAARVPATFPTDGRGPRRSIALAALRLARVEATR